MIIVKLQGGLGNQLFQYACGRFLSIDKKVELYLDISGYREDGKRQYMLDNFNISAKKYIKKSSQKFISNYHEDVPYKYDKSFTDLGESVLLNGYFQSLFYFQNIRDVLQKEISSSIANVSEKMRKIVKSEYSVAIHVRRGDYISNPKVSEELGFCGRNYYIEAMDFVKNKVRNPHFIIFSDDIEWCRDNLPNNSTSLFCSTENAATALTIMKLCRHHIISNSSFSWWAAYLGEKEDSITVLPKPWWRKEKWDTKELILPKWIEIKR